MNRINRTANENYHNKHDQSAPGLRPTHGFTIVELLIVVVLIAILAAITIVAYNGLQKRAQTSAVSTALNQASKKVKLYQVDNNTYPTTLATAGVTDSGVTYQYSGSTTTFCITGTQGSTSLYLSDTVTKPTEGGCAGHGQGGVAAITNLATSPKPVGATSNYQIYWGVNGTGTAGIYNDAGLGRPVWRATWSVPSTSSGGSFWVSDAIITVGSRYQLSQTIRSSKNVTVSVLLVWVNAASTIETGSASLGNITLTAGSSRRIGGSAVAPAGTGRMRIIAYATSGSWSAGDTLDTWDTMFVQSDNTSLYNYADGSSPSWVWNGGVNASTSTGPAL